MAMRFSDDDINRLIRAVEYYKDTTGSEWIWDEYDSLAKKLRVYLDQYSPAE